MNNNKTSDIIQKPILITVIFLIVIAIFVRHQLSPITPLEASAEQSVFSAGRAFDAISDLTKEQVPHPVDSKANQLVASRLIDQLRAMGYQEEIQETGICRDSRSGWVRCTLVRNIIVHIAGKENNRNGILISAHYDSVPASAGGSDAGAAVGTLIEIARLLRLEQRPKNSIVLLFNEGEEFGLFGAHAFMTKHPLAQDLRLALNIEARGSTGQSVMFETGEDSGWLVEHYANSTPAPLASSLFYEVYKFLPNDTDLTVFKSHGLQGLNFAHAEQEPHYHTTLDNLETLNKGSLQHHGDNVWGVLKQIKDQDLTQTKLGNLVYTDILGLFVVQWDESANFTILIIIVAILIMVLFFQSKTTQLSIAQILIGIMASISTIVIAGATAWGIMKMVVFMGDSSAPWRANQLPMQIAIWAGVAWTCLTFLKWISRSGNRANLAIGITTSWLLLAAACCVWLPGISFLFLIPAAVAILTMLVQLLINKRLKGNSASFINSGISVALSIIPTMAAAVIFMPVVYTLEIMVSYPMAIALGIVLSFVFASMLPLFSEHKSKLIGSERSSNDASNSGSRLITLSLCVASISGIFWTAFQAPFSQWTPQPLNLLYWQNHENNASLLVESRYQFQPEELLTALDKVDIQNENTETQETLERSALFPWSKREYLSREVASQSLPSTEITIVKDETVSTIRNVSLSLKSKLPALSDIILYIPVSSGLEAIKKNEKVFDYEGESNRSNGYYQLHCRGQSCADQVLNFSLSSDNKFELLIVQIAKGLPQAFKEVSNNRGVNAVQRQNGDQKMVLTRIEI